MSVEQLSIDRRRLTVSRHQEPNVAFWRDKSKDERWRGIEALRQIAHGYDPLTERVQRVLEVAQRS